MAAFAYGSYRSWRKTHGSKTLPTSVYPTRTRGQSRDSRPSSGASGSSTRRLPPLPSSVSEPDLIPYVDVHEIPDILPETPTTADVPDVLLSVPDTPATTDFPEVPDSSSSTESEGKLLAKSVSRDLTYFIIVRNAVAQIADVSAGHRHYGGTGGNGEGPFLGQMSFHNSFVNLIITGGTGGDGGAAGSIGGDGGTGGGPTYTVVNRTRRSSSSTPPPLPPRPWRE
ncbi:hypothetical protein B0H12DRAFT_1232082 [Mycena haematopus]|nr:hypothetical protein B0H12DRAFT_1232082 [Mycena haematopus]